MSSKMIKEKKSYEDSNDMDRRFINETSSGMVKKFRARKAMRAKN